MFFCPQLFSLLIYSFFLNQIIADPDLNANGPFGKSHAFDQILQINQFQSEQNDLFPVFTQRSQAIEEIQVSKTTYINYELIQITWTPITPSCKDDFIAIYSLDVSDELPANHFDYERIQNKQTSSIWRMINLRQPLNFRYYSRDNTCSGNYTLVAKSATVQPVNFNEPTHVHIAYGDDVHQMYVSYLTNSSEYTPKCQYGLAPDSLDFIEKGTTITYKASDMCEGKAIITGPQNFIDPGFMHTMLLKDLQPSTTYYYRVGTNKHGWSNIYSFTNRPADKQESVYMVAYGDIGVTSIAPAPGADSTMQRVTARVLSSNFTCLLHIGDVSYARGFSALWDAFMIQIQSVASHIPYMTGIGNHEYDHVTGGDKDPSHAPGEGGFRPKWGDYGTDSGGECAVPMVHRFHSPSNGNGLFWYSFNVGPVHILMFSTEHDFLVNSTQYEWIENDLSSVDRSETPWLIVGSHRHMYSSEDNIPGENNIAANLQSNLEPLFYKYHVDLNLFAHRHSYERTCPMFQNKCISDGVTHVLIGMAGQSLEQGKYKPMEWSIYHDQQFGYTTIYANQTYLQLTYYHDSDDQIADQFELHK